MEVRTQIVIVAAVALAWIGGQWVRVRPVIDRASDAERMSLGALEQRVAQHPDDAVATRVLLRRYLDHSMPRVVHDTVRRAPQYVQRDGVVSLVSARAEEALGNVTVANAVVNGALARCSTVPMSLVDHVGCDVRTQAELSILGAALDRMIQWNVTPLSDPARASLAHELATRPVRISIH
jgi:hypothetical protein